MGKFRLDLIGPFGLFDPGGARIDITSKKSIAIIALLAMSPSGVRSRVWLQNMLWGSRGAIQAQGSLRRELSTLASLFGRHNADHLLVREQSRISLLLDALDVDALSLAIGLVEPMQRSSGDFLEGLDLADAEEFEDWLRDQRAHCEDLQRYTLPDTEPPPTAAQVLGTDLPATLNLLNSKPPNVPPKPSVALLPFQTADADGGHALLGAGIAEEIEFTLTRFKTLFVVSGTSASALAAQGMTAQETARRLGVRYLIDGKVNSDGKAVKANIGLIDGANGQKIWGHRFTGDIDNLFALQEQIAFEVAPRIHSQIDIAELRGGLAGPARDGNAYQLYWRANALFRNWDRASNGEARLICAQLVEAEPNSPWACAMSAFCNAMACTSGWVEDVPSTRRLINSHYETALRFGGEEPMVLGYAAGTIVTIGGDITVADRLISHALNIVPAFQPTLFWGGWVDIAQGKAQRARERFELSLRINPEAGVRAYAITGIGIALLMDGQLMPAYTMLMDSFQYIPTYPITLAALAISANLLGKQDVAHKAATALHEHGGLDQVLTLLQNPSHRAMLTQGLRLVENEVAAG